jgi:DNA-binding transcriptional LysR family regulator
VRIALSPPLIRHIGVVHPKERIHSRLVSAFIQFAKERLRASQADERRAA